MQNKSNVSKKVLHILFSIFLLFITIQECKNLYNYSSPIPYWKGIYIPICITGIFAFIGFSFPTYRLLPEKYYQIRNPKFLVWIYRYGGLKIFGWLLSRTIYSGKNGKKYFNGKKSGLELLMKNSKMSEFGHLLPFLITNMIIITCFKKHQGEFYLSMIITNTLFNLYPILLQRWHRHRMSRFFSIIKK